MRERYAGSSRGFHTFAEALEYFLDASKKQPREDGQEIRIALTVEKVRHPLPESNYWSVDTEYFHEVAG